MSTSRPTALFLFAVLCGAGALALPARALAQVSMGSGGGGGGGDSGGSDADDQKKKPAPPSAIPGAVAGTVAPATRNAADLDPNAALFDAIDRGDITAARDALARGADLNARNVLGQKPIDLSVDLSRNDITFLLLSMRSENGDEAPADSNADEVAADAQAASARSAHFGGGGRAAGGAEFAASSHSSAPEGGTPQPSAGFLGFGGQ